MRLTHEKELVLHRILAMGIWLLALQPGVSAKCSDLSSDMQISVDWWSVLPYSTRVKEKNGNYSYNGIFPNLLNSLSNETGIKIRYNEPMSNFQNFTSVASTKTNNTVYFPMMKEGDTDDACFIPVLKTNGPAYIIHIEKIVPLQLLGKGLLQGWQVIALTLVLAAISGIFIWIMDRQTNPEDFPPNFFAGVWQGFWWAFVTMTTVGYGDTAPRSVTARLYSILWMIIGMIAFSVLTANITSSLSQKSFDAEEKMFGKRVGVLDGTMDAQAALMENAHVINHDSVTELLRSLESRRVDGILVERYVAGAHYNKYKGMGMELGTLISSPYYMGLMAPSFITGRKGDACAMFKECVLNILHEGQIATKVLMDLSNAWQNFEMSESTSLFEDESFFYILIAFFFALLGVGGLWHYFVYLPRQRQAIADSEKGTAATNEKYIILKEELEMLCTDCRPKLDSVLEENPDREYHDSILPFIHGTPNLKLLTTNALDQLKRMPSNAAGVLPGTITARRKAGRVQ